MQTSKSAILGGKQLFISNHKRTTLRTIETDLNLFFALLQASTEERLGKKKTIFHKGILRAFFWHDTSCKSTVMTSLIDIGHVPLILFCNWLVK